MHREPSKRQRAWRLDDPKDDPYIDCGSASGAPIILSRDRHFRHPNVEAFGLRVMSAGEYLADLRVPAHILEQAKAAAAEERISINQLLLALISEGLGHRRGLLELRSRAVRANVAESLRILDFAPDVAPDGGDEMPSGGARSAGERV